MTDFCQPGTLGNVSPSADQRGGVSLSEYNVSAGRTPPFSSFVWMEDGLLDDNKAPSMVSFSLISLLSIVRLYVCIEQILSLGG